MERCKTLKPALLCLVTLSCLLPCACGGSSEAAPPPSSPQAQTSAESAEQAAPEETAAIQTAPSPDSEAAPSSGEGGAGARASEPESESAAADRLASELEKRRKAAQAQSGDEADSPKPEDAAPAEPVGPTYKGPDPCRAKTFNVERVREACESGGRASAKRVMRDAITKAIAMSQSFVCADCHVNQKDYSLKPNAVADLKSLLQASE